MLYSYLALVGVFHSLLIDVITFSSSTFTVVLLPALYAACVIGILLDNFGLFSLSYIWQEFSL